MFRLCFMALYLTSMAFASDEPTAVADKQTQTENINLNDTKLLIESIVKRLLIDIRSKMPKNEIVCLYELNGSYVWNDLSNGVILRLNLSHLNVLNLESFESRGVFYDMENYRLFLEFYAPLLQFAGDYETDGVFFHKRTKRQNTMKADVKGVKLKVLMKAIQNEDGTFYFDEFGIDYKFDDIRVTLGGDEDAIDSEHINKYVSYCLCSVINVQITTQIEERIMSALNKRSEGIPLLDVSLPAHEFMLSHLSVNGKCPN